MNRTGLLVLTLIEVPLGLFMIRIAVDAWVSGGVLAGIVASFLTAAVVGSVWALLWSGWRGRMDE